MSLGLVTRASSGWRRVFGIADQGLIALLVRVRCILASQNGSFLEAALVQNRHFWRLVRVRALADQNGSFLKADLVQNRHFWRLVRVRASLGGAVSWGLLTRAWSGWRRVIGLGEQGVVWAAPCLGASSGWRCVIRIGDQGIVWVAPCLWDC